MSNKDKVGTWSFETDPVRARENMKALLESVQARTKQLREEYQQKHNQ